MNSATRITPVISPTSNDEDAGTRLVLAAFTPRASAATDRHAQRVT